MSDIKARLEKALLGMENALEGLPENEVISVIAVTFAAQYRDMDREGLKYRLVLVAEQALQNYDNHAKPAT